MVVVQGWFATPQALFDALPRERCPTTALPCAVLKRYELMWVPRVWDNLGPRPVPILHGSANCADPWHPHLFNTSHYHAVLSV